MDNLSILIPADADDFALEETLASVLRNRPDNCEVIVAHDGSYSDPHGISDEVTLVAAQRGATTEHLVLQAMAYARGSIVHVLRPGIEVDEGWQHQPLSMFSDASVGSVSPRIVDPSRRGRVVADGLRLTRGFHRRLVRNRRGTRAGGVHGPTLWAAFYRREALDWLLPFLSTSSGRHMLDAEIALAMDRIGYRCITAADCVLMHDRSDRVLSEANLSDAAFAERLATRYSNSNGMVAACCQIMRRMAGDLFAQPHKPLQAVARLSACSSWREDRAWAVQLKQIARHVLHLLSSRAANQPNRWAA